jgi:predicted component of type VI protein secretion system
LRELQKNKNCLSRASGMLSVIQSSQLLSALTACRNSFETRLAGVLIQVESVAELSVLGVDRPNKGE